MSAATITPADLTTSQVAFMRLHVRHMVERWQWHFCGSQLRAHAGTNRATVSSDELADLVSRGLARRGGGEAVYATKTAKAIFA